MSWQKDEISGVCLLLDVRKDKCWTATPFGPTKLRVRLVFAKFSPNQKIEVPVLVSQYSTTVCLYLYVASIYLAYNFLFSKATDSFLN